MSCPQMDERPVTEWIEQIKQGDEAALQKIWSTYASRLLGIARRQLSRHVAMSADEDDLVQSAVWSFYRRARDGGFPNLNDRRALWKLLVAITLNKSRALGRKEVRRLQCLKREFADRPCHGEDAGPELAVQLADHLQELMRRLDDSTLRRVATAKLDGCSNTEIARQIGKSVPTVERKLHLIRHIWARSWDD